MKRVVEYCRPVMYRKLVLEIQYGQVLFAENEEVQFRT